MNRSPALIGLPKETPTPQTSGRFPGIAQRKWNGDITLVKGTVIYASSRVQYVQPRAKYLGFWQGGIVHLIGDSYLYCCEHCGQSVVQWALPSIEDVIIMTGRTVEQIAGPFCPNCWKPLSEIHVGDKVLLHYRQAEDKSWGTWFAERRDW